MKYILFSFEVIFLVAAHVCCPDLLVHRGVAGTLPVGRLTVLLWSWSGRWENTAWFLFSVSPSGERRNRAPGFVLSWRVCYAQGHTTLGETTTALCAALTKAWKIEGARKAFESSWVEEGLELPSLLYVQYLLGKRKLLATTWHCIYSCLHFSWKFSARWVEIMKNLEWLVCHDLGLGNSRCWVSFFVFVFLLKHLQ